MPTATIVTPPFLPLAEAGREAAGMANLVLHILPRGIGAMNPEQVEALAEEQVDKLVSDLLGTAVANRTAGGRG